MHGTQAELKKLFAEFQGLAVQFPKIQIAVFPPFVYLPQLIQDKETNISIGAQNHAAYLQGAYTGEVSSLMLKDIGCEYVLLGHSERRNIFGETDAIVAQKFALAKECQLKPVLCIGETEAQRDTNETEAVVKKQIDAILQKVGIAAFADTVIAYEPVWAIGTGRTPTLDEIQAVHATIRHYLAEHDKQVAEQILIIYGGSMKPDNASGILALPDVDGGLIGGASLKAADFKQICEASSYNK